MGYLGRLASIVGAVTLLAGCGVLRQAQDDTQPPIGVPGAMAQTRASAQDLLYVSRVTGLLVYTYPDLKRVGFVDLNGLENTGAVCPDPNGDIFVPVMNSVGGQTQVYEFAHGGSYPIATLEDPNGPGNSCSVDPKTGNLALTDSFDVAIYAGGQGNPTYFTDSSFGSYIAPAYDGNGNLFVTGYSGNASAPFVLAELPYGSNRFIDLSIDQEPFLYNAGQIQWDGTYLAISAGTKKGRRTPIVIYRVQVSGSTASVVQTITFDRWKSAARFWIEGNKLIATGYKYASRVGIWGYPSGGGRVAGFSSGKATYDPVVSDAPHG